MRILISSAAFFVSFFTVSFSFAEEHKIDQKNKTFSKSSITIKKGDSITFSNSDTVTHNVFSKDEAIKFDLKTQKPGQESKITFDKSGKGEVRCAIHPNMKLQVEVQE
jgi:plastocyanin